MFREMRRKKQQLSEADAVEILRQATAGTLACLGDEGYPYAVPLSFAWTEGKIFFHCAKSGHKLDAILTYPKVSFSIIDRDEIVSSEYTTYFRSVIVFGTARIARDQEWTEGMRALMDKYAFSQPEEHKQNELDHCENALVIVIDIEHLTGKEAIELVRKKQL